MFIFWFVLSMVGVEQVYVHVNRSKKSAQELYQKMGFEVMWMHLFLLYFWLQFLAFSFYSWKDWKGFYILDQIVDMASSQFLEDHTCFVSRHRNCRVGWLSRPFMILTIFEPWNCGYFKFSMILFQLCLKLQRLILEIS